MKVLLSAFALVAGSFLFGQAVDLEDRDDSFILDNNKNILKISIEEPFYQIPIKGCTSFEAAGFEGGVSAYKALLTKYMYNFLNSDFYRLNGEFSFTLKIDESGKVVDVESAPKIQFSEVFFDDMQYIVRRIKKNWTPAKCNSKPVISQMKIKMNFSSVTADM